MQPMKLSIYDVLRMVVVYIVVVNINVKDLRLELNFNQCVAVHIEGLLEYRT